MASALQTSPSIQPASLTQAYGPTLNVVTAPGWQAIDGSVTSPLGFQAAGIHTGVKRKRKDLALIYSGAPCAAAGVFTTNVVKAAPVLWSQAQINHGQPLQAIVCNSGNANACTGPQGMIDTEAMALATAHHLFLAPSEVLVASTGVIGVPLEMAKITPGIEAIATELGNTDDDGMAAAEAICTTDTATKTGAVSVTLHNGHTITVGAIAKGSGMIHPNMATMLSFITTDCAIDQPVLQQLLKESVNNSYNMISVDGDTSTNDMVLMLANGLAGNPAIEADSTDYHLLKEAIHHLNVGLAKAIAKDGEGATTLITVQVEGAVNEAVAKALAKSVCSSSLVKAAVFGADANWGRILCAMGYANAPFNPDDTTIGIHSVNGSVILFQNGLPQPVDETLAKSVLTPDAVTITIALGDGTASATAWGCDLTYEYVKINGEYRS